LLQIEKFINKLVSLINMNTTKTIPPIVKYIGTAITAVAAALIIHESTPENYHIPSTRATQHVYGLEIEELESALQNQIPNIKTANQRSLIPYIEIAADMVKKSNSDQLDVLETGKKADMNAAKRSYSTIIKNPFDPIVQESSEGDSLNVFRYNRGKIGEIKITFGKGSEKDYDDSGKLLGISPRKITIETYTFQNPHDRKESGKKFNLELDTYNNNYTLGDIVDRFNNR